MTLDPARVFATLDRHEVDHVTIGAFAVIAHGYVRATADIDLMARQDRDNLERLAAAFAELRARLPGVDAEPLELDPPIPPRWPTVPASRSTRTRARSVTSTTSPESAATTSCVPERW
jgi:hypothetical protein